MGASEYMAVGLFLMTILFGVIGFLLAKKDAKQATIDGRHRG